jgi:16S rRNA (cytidine1402-2'-O)-methyltransferase
VAAGGAGRLLVVGTPIGNLADLSPRAAESLRTADLVVAEDTRMAARLLAHLGARVATVSFNAHNAASRLPALVDRLAAGERLALTTDAGMPAISDPGALLVAAARRADVPVEVVPGPTAVTAAMALAGVEASGFLFGGFLPSRPASARRDRLAALVRGAATLTLPLVLFEAPHRITKLLADLAELAPESWVAVGRELTKRHEQVVTGPVAEVVAGPPPARGEFTIVVSSLAASEGNLPSFDLSALADAAQLAGLSPRSVVELLRAAGVPRREAYQLARTVRDR